MLPVWETIAILNEKRHEDASPSVAQGSMPILLRRDEMLKYPDCPTEIPMRLLSERQAEINHNQTLKRLAERGGVGPDEAVALIACRRWEKMDMRQAINLLKRMMA